MIWFSCHQYAALDVGGVDYVFDACAGPFGGDCLRADYLNRAIDRSGCEFFLLSQVRFSRRRRCRTQKCGQLDLSSTRACWLVICQVWLSRVARRQMRAVRVMRLGMRTYRLSCMDVTDSICRRAAILSPHIANFR